MEDDGVGQGVGGLESGDRQSLRVLAGIAGGRHDDRGAGGGEDLQLLGVERALGAGEEKSGEVAADAREDGLGLGVAETAVELQDVDAGGADHEAAVEDAAVGDAAPREFGDDGLEDLLQREVADAVRDDRGGGVGAHAARVGAFVVVIDALVVLRGGEKGDAFAVDEGEERGLFAFEEGLDEERGAGRAELVVVEDGADRGFGLGARLGDDNALAGREAVGLDDDGNREAVERGERGGRLSVGFGVGGGHAGRRHDFLGEGLAALHFRRSLTRTENGDAEGGEPVGNAEAEGRLGADDDEIRPGELAPRHEVVDVLRPDGHVGGQGGRPRVARRAEELVLCAVLRESPNDGVFASAAADD